MKKKFALSTIAVLTLVFVMCFSICGMSFAEGSSLREQSIRDFGKYTELKDVIWGTDYDAGSWKTAADLDAIISKPEAQLTAADYDALFQAFAVTNYSMVSGKAQMTVTNSTIELDLFQKSGAIVMIPKKQATIRQVSTWATIDNGKGLTYDRTISGMLELTGIGKSITDLFGYWAQTRIDNVTGEYEFQKGKNGTQQGIENFDADSLGGVSCTWQGTPAKSVVETNVKKNAEFDVADLEFVSDPEAASAKYNNITIRHDTGIGKGDQLANFLTGTTSKNEMSKYKVIEIEYDVNVEARKYTVDSKGNLTGEYTAEPIREDTIKEWYCWDELEGKYVDYVADAHGVCIVNRNTGLANFVINSDTIDISTSGIKKKTADGKTYYEISFGLKKGGKYETIDEVCKGELKSMQAGTKGTVDFAANYTTFNNDITLVLSVWDNGLLKEFYREYSFHTGKANRPGQYCTVLGDGNSRGQAEVLNVQKQVFGYDEAVLSQIPGFKKGSLSLVQEIIIIVVVIVVVLVALIVTLVVLAKKGIIGKKARARRKAAKQAAEEGQLLESAEGETPAEDTPAVEEDKKEGSDKE